MSLTLTRRYNVDRFGYLIPTKYGNVPMVGAVATYRPDESRFGRGAVAVEEGTTNLANNPTFSGAVGTRPSGWSSDVTIQQDDFFGQLINAAELLCVSGDEYEDFGTGIAYPLAYNTTYTISFWARGTIEINYGLSTTRGIASATWKSRPPMSLQWQRYEVTIVTVSSGSIYPFWWYLNNVNDENVGEWVRIARIQLEQKPFATSFVDGTRPDGILAYPVALPDDYTIACYRKSHTDEDYKQVVKRSDGKVFVDGVEDSEYDVGWLGCDGDTLMLSNQTGLVDELLILPYAASEEEIVSWYEAQGPLPPHPQALLQWDWQAVRPATMVKL